MDSDGPRKSESMSMDIDDSDTAESCHPHRSDPVKMNTSGPSDGSMLSNFHPQNHQIAGFIQTSLNSLSSHPPPDCERLPGLDDSHQFMILPSPSSPVNRLGETSDICQIPELARQHKDILPSLNLPRQEVIPRKRKRTYDLPDTHIMDHNHIPHDDAFLDGANPQSRRRIRPRLRIQLDGEFSPLLIMSPGREQHSHVEEEMVSAFHYSSNVTEPSHSIARYFHFDNPPEHGPRILQSSSSPEFDNLENRKERGRSDSTNSFAQVALASTVAPKHGRLSTLQDFWLPRPFEETERPFSGSINLVHERGLEAPPSFLSASGGRMGGLWASCEPTGSPTDAIGRPIRPPIWEHAVSPRSTMLPLEPSSTNFFDKPICDSPDPIDPDEDRLQHLELPTQVTQGARVDFTPRDQSVCREAGDGDGR